MGFGDILSAIGAENLGMQLAGLNAQQIEAIEQLRANYPAVEGLDLTGLMTDGNMADLKQDVLEMVENPELAQKFGEAMQGDPDLVQRVNALAHSDPQKLREVINGFREDPDNLAGLLRDNVTDEQLAVEVARAQEQGDGNFLTQMQSQLGDMLSGINWESIGAVLLAIVNGINGLTESLVGGIQRLVHSDEVVMDGNGGPNGPGAQFFQAFGINPEAHQETAPGQVVSGPAQNGTQPQQGVEPDAAAQPGPDQVQQPGPEPEMSLRNGPAR